MKLTWSFSEVFCDNHLTIKCDFPEPVDRDKKILTTTTTTTNSITTNSITTTTIQTRLHRIPYLRLLGKHYTILYVRRSVGRLKVFGLSAINIRHFWKRYRSSKEKRPGIDKPFSIITVSMFWFHVKRTRSVCQQSRVFDMLILCVLLVD